MKKFFAYFESASVRVGALVGALSASIALLATLYNYYDDGRGNLHGNWLIGVRINPDTSHKFAGDIYNWNAFIIDKRGEAFRGQAQKLCVNGVKEKTAEQKPLRLIFLSKSIDDGNRLEIPFSHISYRVDAQEIETFGTFWMQERTQHGIPILAGSLRGGASPSSNESVWVRLSDLGLIAKQIGANASNGASSDHCLNLFNWIGMTIE